MAVKTYQLNIIKSDGTSESVSFTIPALIGTYNIKFTLSDGQEIDAGNITVDYTQHSYNLKLTLSDGSTINAGTIVTPVVIPTFGELSWDKIAEISESGKASTLFAVGDEKTIELSTGEEIKLVILGFDHDDLSDGGGKVGITIGMKNRFSTDYSMSNVSGNNGGWADSYMRKSTMATMFSQLPSDLQGVIKEVNKKSMAGNKSISITTSADKLWLLSEVEVDGTSQSGYIDEGEQYEYWQTVRDGTKPSQRQKGAGWWLRSPVSVNTTEYTNISAVGNISGYNSRFSSGVSFAFCV